MLDVRPRGQQNIDCPTPAPSIFWNKPFLVAWAALHTACMVSNKISAHYLPIAFLHNGNNPVCKLRILFSGGAKAPQLRATDVRRKSSEDVSQAPVLEKQAVGPPVLKRAFPSSSVLGSCDSAQPWVSIQPTLWTK